MKMSDLKFGDCVKVACSATGRYLGNGKALFVSALDGGLCEDNVKKPIVVGNPYNLPMPDDQSLKEHLHGRKLCPHYPHPHKHLKVIYNGENMEKEIIVKIDERWQRECLESIFGDEDISSIHWDYNDDDTETEYEMECILRRVIKKSAPTN